VAENRHASKENLPRLGGTNPQNNYTSLNMNTTDFLKNVLKQCLNSAPIAHKQKAHLKGLNSEKEIIILSCILLLHNIYIYIYMYISKFSVTRAKGLPASILGHGIVYLKFKEFSSAPLLENVGGKHYTITAFKSLLPIKFLPTFISYFSGM
jgi:hypothetical protein